MRHNFKVRRKAASTQAGRKRKCGRTRSSMFDKNVLFAETCVALQIYIVETIIFSYLNVNSHDIVYCVNICIIHKSECAHSGKLDKCSHLIIFTVE